MHWSRIPDPSFLLALPPMQFVAGEMVRPDGTLGVSCLDAALSAAGYRSSILDMSVGRSGVDSLEETFYRQQAISERHVRVGMSTQGSPFERPLVDKKILHHCQSLVWKLLNSHERVEEFSAQLRKGV